MRRTMKIGAAALWVTFLLGYGFDCRIDGFAVIKPENHGPSGESYTVIHGVSFQKCIIIVAKSKY